MPQIRRKIQNNLAKKSQIHIKNLCQKSEKIEKIKIKNWQKIKIKKFTKKRKNPKKVKIKFFQNSIFFLNLEKSKNF